MKRILLLGNPNCGKTTLFNALTDSRLATGNRPGVTVKAAVSSLKIGKESFEIVDLPGVYSLSAYSPEEQAVLSALNKRDFDAVVTVLDATNPLRGLYLAFLIMAKEVPMVLAFNFCDRLAPTGQALDIAAAQAALGVCCVAVSAGKGTGLSALTKTLKAAEKPRKHFPCEQAAAYREAEKLVPLFLRETSSHSELKRRKSFLPDKVLLHPKLAYPFLFLFTALLFLVTFSGLTSRCSGLLDTFFSDTLCTQVQLFLEGLGCNPLFNGLITDGIIKGTGAVLSFLPQIAVLTLLMALFEDSGYLSRTAYLCDRPLRKFGLQGKCFFCAMMGFGCTVPAALSTRILENPREKRNTLFLLPFLPCSAKLPLFLLFGELFFGNALLLPVMLYLLGTLLGLGSLFVRARLQKRNARELFVLELPPYHLPSPKSVGRNVQARLKEFLVKAGTVLVIDSILVWLLSNFTPLLQYTALPEESILACIGKGLLFVFRPMGITQWQLSAAFLSGGIAREAIVSSVKILYNHDTFLLRSSVSAASALAYAVFSLLWLPCSAALFTLRREAESRRHFLRETLFRAGFAYLIACLTYGIGRMFL